MADIVFSELHFDSITINLYGYAIPFIRASFKTAATMDPSHNTITLEPLYSSSSDLETALLGIQCAVGYAGIDAGSETVIGTGDIKIHRRVSNSNVGLNLLYNSQNLGTFRTGSTSSVWRYYKNYQFVFYDIDNDKYWLPVADYILMSRYSAATDLNIADPTTIPLSTVTASTSSPTGLFSNINIYYYDDINDVFKSAVTPVDPYADGGYSGGGGGDGSFDLHNDSIDFPSVPTLSAVDTGLVSIYTPTLAQLKALATFLWNANPTDIDWWKKLVANPLDLILGLSIVPVAVPQGATQTIKVGLIDTGVSATKAASQFVTVDCGSITIQKNCGGSALDYSPFTKFSIYLPFIGTRTISCDDIMGRTVHVKYNVDLLSGGCTAMVKITGGPEDNEVNAVMYQYSGACAISVPLTGETFTNMITSTIQLAASIGATVATGGAAAGVTAASAANSLMSMKPIIERAGGVSGAAGQLGVMIPYLIAEVPRQSVPENCNQFTGYPSNMKAVIGDLTGYTEVEIIYLKGIEATQEELDELETVLKGGFII